MDPAHERQWIKSFPTPKVADVLFFESFHGIRANIPAYGTAHPRAEIYPNHKLCFAEAADNGGMDFRVWYCADRANQDDYNLVSLEYPYGGSTDFPRIVREYVLPRGTSSGQSREPIELGTTDSVYTTAVLVEQSTKPIDGQIGTLYEKAIRIFDIIPGTGDTGGIGTGQTDNGYTIDRPREEAEFLRLTWKLVLPRTIADGHLSTNFTNCPIPGFGSLELVNEKVEASDNDNQKSNITRIYEGNAAGVAFPSAHPVVSKEKQYPGSVPPDKFITNITEITENKEIKKPEDVLVTDLAPGSGNTLIKVDVKPTGVLRGTKDVNYASYSTSSLIGQQWDERSQRYIPYTAQIVAKATADALVATAGQELTVQPLNTFWSIVTTEVPPTGDDILYTTTPFSWPQVLTNLFWGGIGVRSEPGAAPTDAYELYFDWEMKPAWSGICKAKITTTFSETNPLAAASSVPISQMDTTGLSLRWPGVTNPPVSIPPCLHGTYNFTGTTGTDHPRYGYVVYSKTWVATTYADWPASLVIDYDVRRYKGGYLIRKVEVLKPY